MSKKGQSFRNHSSNLKISAILDMRENHLGIRETGRKYGANHSLIQSWERVYIEEGAEGLMKERRGVACKESGTRKGRPPKLNKQVEEDIIAENQRLRMEIEYLKKLYALVQKRMQGEKKKQR